MKKNATNSSYFYAKILLLRRGLENYKTASPNRTLAPMVCYFKLLAMQYMWKDIWISQIFQIFNKSSHL
jgi:hypothetical protein